MDLIGLGQDFEELCGLDSIGSDDCNPLFFHLYIFYINN